MDDIWVLDDDRDVLDIVEGVLGSIGLRLRSFQTFSAFSQAYSLGCRPKVLLLDIQMPDQDGYSVIDYVASLVNPPKVILFSSSPKELLNSAESFAWQRGIRCLGALTKETDTLALVFNFFLSEENAPSEPIIDVGKLFDGGALQPYYQPIIDLTTGDVTGFESLIRANGKAPSPRLLRLLDQPENAAKLWLFNLRAALQVLKEHGVRSVSINTPASVLTSRDFWPTHGDYFKSDVQLFRRIKLELTESNTIGDDWHLLSVNISRLKAIGVAVDLDDLFKHQSTPLRLRQHPFSGFKTDRSFLTDLAIADDQEQQCQTIALLGAALRFTITAEGIETREQLQVARQFAQLGQGYLFKPAIPKDQVGQWIEAWRKSGLRATILDTGESEST